MRALIDMDIVTWRAGFASQSTVYDIYRDEEVVEEGFTKGMADMYLLGDEDIYTIKPRVVPLEWELAKYFCSKLINSIIDGSEATNYIGYLGGVGNFRKELDPEYKANRKELPSPYWKEDIRKYIIEKYNVIVINGIEADDAIAIEQTLHLEDESTIICSIDKDMRQVPGHHYHIVDKKKFYVTQREGDQFLYSQMLMGDVADNVKGIKGIGPKKAAKMLEDAYTVEEMSKIVKEKYIEVYGLDADDFYNNNFNMLYLLRTQEEADDRCNFK